ncbi:efflux RND transporter periplasmic adaptor subunit [Halotalea alkalilenta]|uniref:Efflux transporter periplasmic adaptor subunit n=1 Tax=Halotalea alkalilenta TaxID=376489 RepID=A0A172YFM0_9GAMM|nr:efflux RND transporter periplasmic adaptor subunit [Halotalea alkalilenta]ANF57997.1 efflux transporter periplasmic adaptor subunit [Halotalea alkalilenta]
MLQIIKAKRTAWGLAGFIALATAGCGNDGNQQQQQGQQEAPAHPAQVYQISSRNIELDKSYPAMIRSDTAASVLARVQGVLEEQHFQPGQLVEKGDPLFTIERATYAAAVAQQRANLASAQADLSNAQRDNQRYQQLFQRGAISAQQRDTASNTFETSRAAVEQARAALESAQIDLDYTTVRAPVSGLVSLNEVNVGNLVSSGTELATVTPLDPLEVRFQLPQSDAMQLRQQQSRSGTPPVRANLEVPSAVGQSAQLDGTLDFIGARVDEGTSSVQARARFSNPDGIFLPGQFVRVRLQDLMRFDVFAVPEIAVTQGLMGPQLYVLDDNNSITSRSVVPGEVAGHWQIISEGLQRGDRVVVSDPGGLNVGDRIDPQPFDGNPDQRSAQQGADESSDDADSE